MTATKTRTALPYERNGCDRLASCDRLDPHPQPIALANPLVADVCGIVADKVQGKVVGQVGGLQRVARRAGAVQARFQAALFFREGQHQLDVRVGGAAWSGTGRDFDRQGRTGRGRARQSGAGRYLASRDTTWRGEGVRSKPRTSSAKS